MHTPHPFDLIIGLDRSDRTADLWVIDTRTGTHTHQSIGTAPEALRQWTEALHAAQPTARVALCLEQPALNLIACLETYSWLTLYPINPVSLQSYRQALVTSRAMDDTKDARYLAEWLFHHHAELRPWQPEEPRTRLLQQLVAHRRAVVDERTALTNRLQALLKQYYPQALELCGDDLWRPLATTFLLKWPSLQALRHARPATLKQFYYRQGSRSPALVQRRLALIASAVALTEDEALVGSYALRVQLVARQLQLLTPAVKRYDDQIAKVYAHHPDRAVFAALPGAGPVLGPRLLVALGTQRDRLPGASHLQRQSGIAPVTKQSGNQCRVHRRYLCAKFLRQSFHEYAKESILHSRWAAAYYWQQRERGGSHHTAVRALAFKWQRIIWRCWQSRTEYQEEQYEAALRKSSSPLVARLDQIVVGKSPLYTRVNKPE
ncbi:MAG: IS110 family transposase ISCfr13 [Verrucomicrobiae bacterium]|nr:IS110 family transposase ISCfr13 [Verrucomicrobiae bacterium]